MSAPRVHLLFNADEYLVARRIDQLRLNLLPEEDRRDLSWRDLRRFPRLLETISFGVSELDGTRVRGPEILAEADVMPFLTPGRLVIVRGYFEQARKRMAPGKRAVDEGDAAEGNESGDEAGAESRGRVLAELEALAAGIAGLPESSILVFVDPGMTADGGRKGQASWPKYVRAFEEHGALIDGSLSALSEQQALPWLRTEARERNIAISVSAAQRLVSNIGPDLRMLVNELEKIALYAGAREITEEDVRLLVSDSKEEMTWTLTDAMAARNTQLAFRTLADFWRDGDSPHMLLAGIINNYRTLLRSKAFAELPAAERDELRRTRKDVWRLEKTYRTASTYRYRQLADILEYLLEANMAITTGADPEATLDVVVYELTGMQPSAS